MLFLIGPVVDGILGHCVTDRYFIVIRQILEHFLDSVCEEQILTVYTVRVEIHLSTPIEHKNIITQFRCRIFYLFSIFQSFA